MTANVVIKQDCVRFSEIFNVKWWPEVPRACHSRGEEGLKNIQWRNNQEIEWTDLQINELFSKTFPMGLDHEITSILDKGYSFFVRDNGMNVRKFWIEKVDAKDDPIEPKNQRIFG